jgi:uncharacterized membrane protein
MLTRIAQLAATEAAVETAPQEEVNAGKTIALASYVFCPIAILPFVKRDNAFSLYHAKQALAMLVVAIVLNVGLYVAALILATLHLSLLLTIVSLAMLAAFVGLIVLGAMNAWNGRMRPLPLIGGLADALFASVRKA